MEKEGPPRQKEVILSKKTEMGENGKTVRNLREKEMEEIWETLERFSEEGLDWLDDSSVAFIPSSAGLKALIIFPHSFID